MEYKLKCKISLDDVLIKDNYYTICLIKDYPHYLDERGILKTYRKIGWYIINEHFYTKQELRKIKIEKLLKEGN